MRLGFDEKSWELEYSVLHLVYTPISSRIPLQNFWKLKFGFFAITEIQMKFICEFNVIGDLFRLYVFIFPTLAIRVATVRLPETER